MMIHDVSCGILPLKFDGKNYEIFLVKNRNGNFWGFPKGHPEKEETYLEAAKRELKEETDLDVLDWIDTEPFIENYSYAHNNELIHKTVYYYVARVSVEYVVDKQEIIDGRWTPLDQANQFLTYKESQNILRQLQEFLDKL